MSRTWGSRSSSAMPSERVRLPASELAELAVRVDVGLDQGRDLNCVLRLRLEYDAVNGRLGVEQAFDVCVDESVVHFRQIGNEGVRALKLTTALYYTPTGRSIHRTEGRNRRGLFHG